MLMEKRSKLIIVLFMIGLISILTGIIALFLYINFGSFKILHIVYQASFVLFIFEISFILVYWCLHHKIKNGFEYAFAHAHIEARIRKQLLDCGAVLSTVDYLGKDRTAILPKIKVVLDKSMKYGQVIISCHLKYASKLETLDLSSALGKYIVLEQYLSDDMNSMIFEIEDSTVDNHLTFNNYKGLLDYAKRKGDYALVINKKYSVPLSSMLITGAVGSGKTYALYGLLGCMQAWKAKPELYLADPKYSSLYALAQKISPEHSYGTPEDIVIGLDLFYERMKSRQRTMKELLDKKIDSDYRDFQLQPLIFVIDEMSAFISVVNSNKKDIKDRVHMILRQIVLMGRQLGCFLWVLQQKSDATDLPTAIRDNLVCKVCLGNVPKTTYITTFETSDIPSKKLTAGQGYFTYMGITREPQYISFPTLNFDIINEITAAQY